MSDIGTAIKWAQDISKSFFNFIEGKIYYYLRNCFMGLSLLLALGLLSIIEETSLHVLDSGRCTVLLVGSLLSVFTAGSLVCTIISSSDSASQTLLPV